MAPLLAPVGFESSAPGVEAPTWLPGSGPTPERVNVPHVGSDTELGHGPLHGRAAEITASAAEPHRHIESEPADQPLWSAIPADTPHGLVKVLVEAVGVRLRAELTGEGRDAFPGVVWLDVPCCVWVEVTGVVADFSGSGAVRVLVEWKTDVGLGGGVSYWAVDEAGVWSMASGEPAS